MRKALMSVVAGLCGSLLALVPALVAGTAVTLPAGTTLHVRLGTTLTSKTNKTGDKFTGMVQQPVIADGKTIVPDGSFVDGHVAFIKPSKRIKGRAEMRMVLDKVTITDDLKDALHGTLLQAPVATIAKTGRDAEGTRKV